MLLIKRKISNLRRNAKLFLRANRAGIIVLSILGVPAISPILLGYSAWWILFSVPGTLIVAAILFLLHAAHTKGIL